MNEKRPYAWQFQRLGGVDQLVLRDGEALRHLPELDPKLWVALSCPTSGLDFDARTLELIDTDRDGRIRIPEVKEAVAWACLRLEDPASMIDSPPSLPLEAISTKTEEGIRLKVTAKAILSILGKEGADSLSQEDVTPAAAKVAANDFNGDGILPPLESLEADVRQYIGDALACIGGRKDGSGKAGIDAEISGAFMESLHAWQSWSKEVSGAAGPLGKDTPEAWDLLRQLKEKIDDYFLRCDLAAFAPQSAQALNPDEKIFAETDALFTTETLAELPLSHIEASAPLRLTSGINPAWRDSLERFLTLVNPLLEKTETLDRDTWKKLQDNFAEYAAALSRKPAPIQVKVAYPPESSIDKLGSARIGEILESGVEKRFEELAAKDARVPAAAADITDVERLVLYHRHLYRLLRNFVSFKDFYSLRRPAIFQAGTLYIDGRSCLLCLNVEDAAKHAEMASLGNLFLLYCECRRVREEAPETPEETMNIVAAVTAGDADLLLKGRNGVFVDNRGRDWDATVVRKISNPISVREAVWDPYRRFARMIEEQINKFAGAKQNDLMTQAGKKLTEASADPGAAAPKFDIGRNVGIFAAVGIALGAIGTAIGSIASALFSLAWWQLPLVFLGIFLIISGPSVVMAWLNLRKRSLGTILEASGWAVNNRVPINLTLAKQLTFTASLPPHATRSYTDPLRKKSSWPVWLLLALLAAGACFGWLRYSGKLPTLWGETPPAASIGAASASPVPATQAGPVQNRGNGTEPGQANATVK